MSYTNPSVDDFKLYFSRDFPFGTSTDDNVLDTDVAKAFMLTNVNINPDLWNSQDEYTIAYELLSAHYLCTNLRNSSQGLAGKFKFLAQSTSVGSVSESYAIPQSILDNALYAFFATTTYGALYLQMLVPRLVGVSLTVPRMTLP